MEIVYRSVPRSSAGPKLHYIIIKYGMEFDRQTEISYIRVIIVQMTQFTIVKSNIVCIGIRLQNSCVSLDDNFQSR